MPDAVSPKPASAKTSPPSGIWDTFRAELNELFDRFGGLSLSALPKSFPPSFGFFRPSCDFIEDATSLKIIAELPGLTENEVEISITDDALVINGEKHEEMAEATNYYVSERSFGSFQRTFQLPRNADREKIDATFARGVLTVTFQKLAGVGKTRKVEITAGTR